MKDPKTKQQKQQEAEQEKKYPGTAIDKADGDTVTPALEKQYTRDLNNNPRNDGQII